MKLILDTLERARLAASPSDADALRVALIDLEALADTLSARGVALDEVPDALGAHQALREHIQTQPFEVADGELLTQGDVVRGPIIDETAPDAFAEWLATLERLAQ